MSDIRDVLDEPARADDLNFRRVVHIFLRTWPFMRPALKHMAVFVGGVCRHRAVRRLSRLHHHRPDERRHRRRTAARPTARVDLRFGSCGLRERGVPLGRGPPVAVLAGDHLDHSTGARGRRRRLGSLLLQHLDLPGHQPTHACHVDRPPAGAIAGVPRIRAGPGTRSTACTRTAPW